MATRAVQYLKQRNVPFEIIKYKHIKKGAEFAAEAVGFALERVVKTLVADLGGNTFCLALVPGNGQLSLKRLARACAVKKVSLADTESAERVTGYLVGGISPFCTKKALSTVMEESLFQFDTVLINAGQRGMLFQLEPDHIKNTLNCRVGRILE